MTNRLENIGLNIRKYRKQQKITQIELAIMVGIDRAYLSEIENGRTNSSINVLYAIADAFGRNLSDFFGSIQRKQPLKISHIQLIFLDKIKILNMMYSLFNFLEVCINIYGRHATQ